MRSNNLLLSLLSNSSANPRSTSLMHKDNYSNPYTSTARSNSVCNVQAAKRQPKTLTAENKMRLVRLVHFLNLKVKNQYYFIFCKLEQILKIHRKNKKQEVQISQYLTIPQQNLANQESIINSQSKVQKRQYDKTLSLKRLCDSFNTFKSKRQIFLQKQSIHTAFIDILDFSKKRKAIIELQILLNKLITKKEIQVWDAFAKIQKERIRNQIFMLNMNQIIAKYQTESFQKIRSFSKTSYLQNISTTTIVSEVKNDFFNQNQQTQPKTEEEYSNKYQNSQKTTRSKKIILRDRKIPTSQPIALTTNKSKIHLTQQKSLNCQINTKLQEKMPRCHNIKTDIIKTCQPDLIDNCFLFREIEWPLVQPKVVYTMQNYYTEFKEPSDFECLTDRSAKYTQPQLSKSLKNTPKYCKDKSSINLAIKKQVNLAYPNQSPLAKIDQILNKIQQMKTYRSTQKSSEKRMVNVNIDKKFQLDQQSAMKYRTKTPDKYFQESQKQNIHERLVTQRQKPVKKVKGLESGCKYRSTMLTKSKQQKTEFTAKKMKMEIQNIINRRNKQLYYRSESTQLN